MSLGLVFACLSITTSRVIRVRTPDRVSLGLGLVFACLSITAFEGYGKLVFGLGLGVGVRVIYTYSYFIK